ncbi:MAG: exosortase T [Candidatus Contendobacter sp.]|jgi:exosortase/archaeosortase family protein|nr:exosortase T [Gammaproteobacteria bacterium]MCC8995204.1 exosortase T [Candidatus Contendobacter sp.]
MRLILDPHFDFYPWFGPIGLMSGLILLAVHPLIWLVATWLDPAYDSYGLWVAMLAGGLLLWSATSPVERINAQQRRLGLGLLGMTATLRLLGQWLGINTLGAAALAVDVYAIGLLLNLDRRGRSLAPGWLAVLFAFALPIERILQRGFGFVLQQLSATGACAALQIGSAPVLCDGIQLQWQGQTVLVDLPCSGTRGLLLLLLLFVALAALTRPTLRYAGFGALIALAAATLGNSLRIVALAAGLVHREALGGVDVLAEPWHSTIGLLTLSFSALPILLWARTGHRNTIPEPPFIAASASRLVSVKPFTGLAFLIACAGIIALPPQPLDIAHSLPTPDLPAYLAAFIGQPGLLTAQEQAYFTRYGGGAARSAYGPYGLLVVSTTAPLRHLHSPEECLAGAGHTVRYLGQTGGPMPSAIYHSIDPHGRGWRIAVSFVSERGELTTHVAEAVWRWLQAPGTTWRMIQRIAPWEASAIATETFDSAAWRALDLPLPSSQPQRQSQPQPLPVKL